MDAVVLGKLDALRDEAFEELCDFLRIASISADSKSRDEMLRCARFVESAMRRAGLTPEVIPTSGYPIVYGQRLVGDDRPTVLVYGHYDVQPPDPLDEWTSPPFEPEFRNGKLYARGATDDKGQLYTHIKSIQAWVEATGELPVNVKFLVEGEEEVGSNNLDNFLRNHRDRLQADVAVISDTSQYGDGIPAITYGLRGIVGAEVRLTGPSQDLHSGIFGGSVANPANAIARLCGSLVDKTGMVCIPGFYDDVHDVTDEERRRFAELPFSEAGFLAETGSAAVFGEEGWSTLECRWIRPTCDVNGILSGYTGEGPKTIVPATATAKITCRLVPGQDPHTIRDSLRNYLEALCPDGLRFEFHSFHGCSAFVLDPNSAWIMAARQAIEAALGRPAVLIREGGSIPVVMSFKQILGIDTLLLGWGRNSDNLHSPNEHIHIVDLENGMLASAHLWSALADVKH